MGGWGVRRSHTPLWLLLLLGSLVILASSQAADEAVPGGGAAAAGEGAEVPPTAAAAGGEGDKAKGGEGGAKPKDAKDAELEERKAKKAAAMAAARAIFIREEEERLEAERRAREEWEDKLRTQPVTYGQVITLQHNATSHLLTATSFRYYHSQGSGQHQVIGQHGEDGYSHWRVMPRAGKRWQEVKDVPVRYGETIRLLAVRTGRVLHSHSGLLSPVSGENEVTNFNGESGSLDTNDNWSPKSAGGSVGEVWHLATPFALQHAPTATELVIKEVDPADTNFNYTMGHPEVSAKRRGNDGEGAGAAGVWRGWPVEGEEVGMDRYVAVYEEEQERQKKFTPPGADADNGPKEISIYCSSNPVVSVQDLDYNLVSEGKCFALNLQSPTFESKLTLNCDGNSPHK